MYADANWHVVHDLLMNFTSGNQFTILSFQWPRVKYSPRTLADGNLPRYESLKLYMHSFIAMFGVNISKS